MTGDQHFDQSYRRAERRLRDALFGDGTFSPGHVKGQDARNLVARNLRTMRESFEAVLRSSEEALAEAGSRVAGLEEELKKIAASKARKARVGSKPKSEKARATAEPKGEKARAAAAVIGEKARTGPKRAARKESSTSAPRRSRRSASSDTG